MNPPPLGVVDFLFKAASLGPGLLGNVQRPGVDDEAAPARAERGVNQLLVLLAAPPVGARQGLAAPHHRLGRHKTISEALEVEKILTERHQALELQALP